MRSRIIQNPYPLPEVFRVSNTPIPKLFKVMDKYYRVHRRRRQWSEGVTYWLYLVTLHTSLEQARYRKAALLSMTFSEGGLLRFLEYMRQNGYEVEVLEYFEP